MVDYIEQINKLKELKSEIYPKDQKIINLPNYNRLNKICNRVNIVLRSIDLDNSTQTKYFTAFMTSDELRLDTEDDSQYYEFERKIGDSIDLLIEELELKNKLNNLDDNKKDITFGQFKKEIDILKYFKNGDKDKSHYQQDHNQEFDKIIFNLLFKKGYLDFANSNIKYSGLETGESYTFRSGTHDQDFIITTAEGNKYVENKFKNHTIDIVGNMSSVRAISDLMKPSKILVGSFNTFKLNSELLNQLKPAKEILELYNSKNLFEIQNQLLASKEAISKILAFPNIIPNELSQISSQILNLKPAIEQLKNFPNFGTLYEDLPKFDLEIKKEEDLKIAKRIIDNSLDVFNSIYNADAYRYIYVIENYLREKIYVICKLDEDADFCKYNQFNESLTSTDYDQILSIIGQMKKEYTQENANLFDDIIKRFVNEKKDKLKDIKQRYCAECNDTVKESDIKLIDFFDFGDLLNILKYKKNSKIILLFCPENKINDYFWDLEKICKIRRKIAHNRRIFKDELNSLENFYILLQRIEKENPNGTN